MTVSQLRTASQYIDTRNGGYYVANCYRSSPAGGGEPLGVSCVHTWLNAWLAHNIESAASCANGTRLMWSADSRYLHFDAEDENGHYWLFRLSIPAGKLERIADLATFPWDENWWGVAPDGTPLGLRATGVSEIYALKCALP